MRGKERSSIGVIVPDIGDDFFSKILEGLVEGAEMHKKDVLIFSCHGKIGREWKCLEQAAKAGVTQALVEQNIKIPEKVSIIGFDDSIYAKIAIPKLTSVRQRPFHIGRKAIRMLEEVKAEKSTRLCG